MLMPCGCCAVGAVAGAGRTLVSAFWTVIFVRRRGGGWGRDDGGWRGVGRLYIGCRIVIPRGGYS